MRRRLDLDRPVEREVILDCLRIATQAPTASNGQTWRWMVVTDADKRRALADLYREAGMGYLEAASQQEQDPQTARVYASALELAEQLERVPVHVIPCVEEGGRRAARSGRRRRVRELDHPGGVELPARARSRGLGSVWTTPHPSRSAGRPSCSASPTRSRRWR
ncbi:MAG: nitroreductase family protein [Acidimicrobiales bacterium]